jgi:hypothetical protein
MRTRSVLLYLLLVAMVVGVGCTSIDRSGVILANTQPGIDNGLVDNEIASIYEILAQIAPNITGTTLSSTDYPTSCMSIDVNGGIFADTLVIDFGSAGCVCTDGIRRRGRIRYVYNNSFRDPAHTGKVLLDNYEAGSSTLSLSQFNITATGTGYTHQIVVQQATYITETFEQIRWSCNRSYEQYAGFSSQDHWNARYRATGTSTGTSRNGKSFTASIEANNPLIRFVSCRNFVAGRDILLTSSTNSIEVDYDDSGLYANNPMNPDACDSKVLCRNGQDVIRRTLR